MYIDSLDEHLYAVRAHQPGEAPAKDDRASSAHPMRTSTGRASAPAHPAPITGTVRWRAPAPGAGYLTPAVAHGLVYQGTYSALLALDAATGQERWELTTGYSFDSIPVVVGGTLYTGSGGACGPWTRSPAAPCGNAGPTT